MKISGKKLNEKNVLSYDFESILNCSCSNNASNNLKAKSDSLFEKYDPAKIYLPKSKMKKTKTKHYNSPTLYGKLTTGFRKLPEDNVQIKDAHKKTKSISDPNLNEYVDNLKKEIKKTLDIPKIPSRDFKNYIALLREEIKLNQIKNFEEQLSDVKELREEIKKFRSENNDGADKGAEFKVIINDKKQERSEDSEKKTNTKCNVKKVQKKFSSMGPRMFKKKRRKIFGKRRKQTYLMDKIQPKIQVNIIDEDPKSNRKITINSDHENSKENTNYCLSDYLPKPLIEDWHLLKKLTAIDNLIPKLSVIVERSEKISTPCVINKILHDRACSPFEELEDYKKCDKSETNQLQKNIQNIKENRIIAEIKKEVETAKREIQECIRCEKLVMKIFEDNANNDIEICPSHQYFLPLLKLSQQPEEDQITNYPITMRELALEKDLLNQYKSIKIIEQDLEKMTENKNTVHAESIDKLLNFVKVQNKQLPQNNPTRDLNKENKKLNVQKLPSINIARGLQIQSALKIDILPSEPILNKNIGYEKIKIEEVETSKVDKECACSFIKASKTLKKENKKNKHVPKCSKIVQVETDNVAKSTQTKRVVRQEHTKHKNEEKHEKICNTKNEVTNIYMPKENATCSITPIAFDIFKKSPSQLGLRATIGIQSQPSPPIAKTSPVLKETKSKITKSTQTTCACLKEFPKKEVQKSSKILRNSKNQTLNHNFLGFKECYNKQNDYTMKNKKNDQVDVGIQLDFGETGSDNLVNSVLLKLVEAEEITDKSMLRTSSHSQRSSSFGKKVALNQNNIIEADKTLEKPIRKIKEGTNASTEQQPPSLTTERDKPLEVYKDCSNSCKYKLTNLNKACDKGTQYESFSEKTSTKLKNLINAFDKETQYESLSGKASSATKNKEVIEKTDFLNNYYAFKEDEEKSAIDIIITDENMISKSDTQTSIPSSQSGLTPNINEPSRRKSETLITKDNAPSSKISLIANLDFLNYIKQANIIDKTSILNEDKSPLKVDTLEGEQTSRSLSFETCSQNKNDKVLPNSSTTEMAEQPEISKTFIDNQSVKSSTEATKFDIDGSCICKIVDNKKIKKSNRKNSPERNGEIKKTYKCADFTDNSQKVISDERIEFSKKIEDFLQKYEDINRGCLRGEALEEQSSSGECSLSLEMSSEGEVKCTCEVSSGELHCCPVRRETFEKYQNVFKTKTQQEIGNNCDKLCCDNLSLALQRVHYDNWVTYYQNCCSENNSSSSNQ